MSGAFYSLKFDEMLTWDIVLLKVRELANRTGMDFSEQIAELEEKYDQVCSDYI